MSKNKQLTFPFESKNYISPYDTAYSGEIENLSLCDGTERLDITEQRLRDAAESICSIFNWDETVEGMYFWDHACAALNSMADELSRRQDPNETDDPWGGVIDLGDLVDYEE